MLSRHARAQIHARATTALVEHQEEHVTLAGDDVMVVRNAVETVDEKARDVGDRLLTVQGDAGLFPHGRRAPVRADDERGPQLGRPTVRGVRHRRRAPVREHYVANAAHDRCARAGRGVEQRLARVRMAKVQRSGNVGNHHRHRDVTDVARTLHVLLPHRA